jgi:hypothetical protein
MSEDTWAIFIGKPAAMRVRDAGDRGQLERPRRTRHLNARHLTTPTGSVACVAVRRSVRDGRLRGRSPGGIDRRAHASTNCFPGERRTSSSSDHRGERICDHQNDFGRASSNARPMKRGGGLESGGADGALLVRLGHPVVGLALGTIFLGFAHQGAERVAAARQAGADGADRHAQDLRHFFVAQALPCRPAAAPGAVRPAAWTARVRDRAVPGAWSEPPGRRVTARCRSPRRPCPRGPNGGPY